MIPVLIALALVMGRRIPDDGISWRCRAAEKEARSIIGDTSRFVDMGVVMRVVVHDPAGRVLVEKCPPMRVLREHRRGGIVERISPRRSAFVGPSRNPTIWHCSVDAEPLILHGDDLPLRMLVYGTMGAGKTSTLAQWLAFRALEATGMDAPHIGATAPTGDRLMMIKEAIAKWWPASWWRWSERHSFYTLANGAVLDLVQTHEQSKAEGSKIQGQNWIAHGGDELQDSIKADSDIEARGRSAPGGRYKRLNTVTAKDSSEWRNFVAKVRTVPLWGMRTMLGTDSPFVDPSWWEQLKQTMDVRTYQRKVLAMDVGPERMTYHTWTRANVRPVPRVGAKHVTSVVLRAKTGSSSSTLLVGHDPGSAKAGTVLLRAYQLPGEPDWSWWVVGEMMTRNETSEQHAVKAMARCKSLGVNVHPDGDRAHVRADPYGKNAKQPDKDVYRVWSRVGFDIRAAQYSEAGTGTGQIKVEARIEMICRLLCDASGRRRLYIDVDDQGQPVAPMLVNALESSERDEAGRAESERKDDTDLSDLPSALSYALWPFEKESAEGIRSGVRKELT